MKKQEKKLFLLLLILAVILCFFRYLFSASNTNVIRITIDGIEYGIYSLSENQQISIGETNVCEISDGTVKMIEANCPDQLCIQQNAITQRGGMIVCLPNKIVIEGGDSTSETSKSEIDAVS